MFSSCPICTSMHNLIWRWSQKSELEAFWERGGRARMPSLPEGPKTCPVSLTAGWGPGVQHPEACFTQTSSLSATRLQAERIRPHPWDLTRLGLCDHPPDFRHCFASRCSVFSLSSHRGTSRHADISKCLVALFPHIKAHRRCICLGG